MLIACIGGRELDQVELKVCELIGKRLANQGHALVSGNTPGAEQAFMRGYSSVNPKGVTLYLPWRNFETHSILDDHKIVCFNHKTHSNWQAIYSRVCPEWDKLSFSVQKILARNVGLIQAADFVISWPGLNELRKKSYEDSLITTMKLAVEFKKPLINLAEPKIRSIFLRKIGLLPDSEEKDQPGT